MKKTAKDIFWTIIISLSICSLYFIFIYRNADNNYIKEYKKIVDYYVYNGKNTYEYWKTTLNDDQQILFSRSLCYHLIRSSRNILDEFVSINH